MVGPRLAARNELACVLFRSKFSETHFPADGRLDEFGRSSSRNPRGGYRDDGAARLREKFSGQNARVHSL